MKVRSLLPLIAFVCAALAYATPNETAAKKPKKSYVAPEGKALVVFVRPKRMGKAVQFFVTDKDRKLLTVFKGKQHATVTVDPGKHTFYVIAENAQLVRAELGAGRTYIIETRPTMGFGKARVSVQPVLRKDAERFAESAQWIKDTDAHTADLKAGEKWMKRHEDRVTRRIERAEADWKEDDEGYRAAHSIGVEDGRTAEEAGKL